MSSKLIIALDYSSAEKALSFIRLLSPEICKLKIGFELFVVAGPTFVKELVDRGYDVFLDLKFHDIPNTVAAACVSAAELGVWMMNVHASGGDKMLLAAKDAISNRHKNTKLIAVTVLTSMDQSQLRSVNMDVDPQSQVLHLAALAKKCGLDGVVCSALEAKTLREKLTDDFLLVTPGIRPVGSDRGDQSRIMTPSQAKKAGVSYVVVGRPITNSSDPLSVIESINIDMA